jgi:hypothetical protein
MSQAMPSTSPMPTAGCVVQCRSHRWLVEEVEPAEHPEGDTVVRMACLDDDANGQRLEALVDASKPPLLTTPFRYPPLRHGSRSRGGSLVESAFYGLLFWEGLSSPPPVPIHRWQTLFSVELNAARGLQLQAIADARAQAVLRDPVAYGPTQKLGEWMREQGIEAFEYFSARSSDDLVQVGIFTPLAFQSTPFDQVEITTEITGAQVSFLCHDDGQLHRYPRDTANHGSADDLPDSVARFRLIPSASPPCRSISAGSSASPTSARPSTSWKPSSSPQRSTSGNDRA